MSTTLFFSLEGTVRIIARFDNFHRQGGFSSDDEVCRYPDFNLVQKHRVLGFLDFYTILLIKMKSVCKSIIRASLLFRQQKLKTSS